MPAQTPPCIDNLRDVYPGHNILAEERSSGIGLRTDRGENDDLKRTRVRS